MSELEFKPTKRWIRDHKVRPHECICPDIPCYCILEHFNEHAYGFCMGITISKENGLDIIVFCDRTFDPETNEPVCASRLWHPSEAQLVSTYLSFAVTQAWQLMPDYRKQLGNMKRTRTRNIH